MEIYYQISSFRRGLGPLLKKFESLAPKDALSQVKLKLAKWFWKKSQKHQKILQMAVNGQDCKR